MEWVGSWFTWIHNFIREHGYAHEILPGVYLGDIVVAYNKPYLQLLGIKTIINTAKEAPNYFPNEFTYYNIGFEDTGRPAIRPELRQLFELIEATLQRGENILLHCMGGVSRSATFMIAYVMWKQKLGFEEAFDYVRSRRQIVNPKPGFLEQLQAYGHELASDAMPTVWR